MRKCWTGMPSQIPDSWVSHYVGMSTHDVGKSVPFRAGRCDRLEPGVYMPEKKLGIRIEDTVLVTRDGCEILTKDVPKEISEIEKLMTEKGLPKQFDTDLPTA